MTTPATGSGRAPRHGIVACVTGGLAAGVVAAALAIAASRLMGGVPPARIAAGSSFTAAVIGGLLFWLLARRAARPAAWLWVVALFFATAVSLVVAFLPPAPLRLPRGLIFLNGLAAPLGQVLHAAGLLHPVSRLAAARPPHLPPRPHPRAGHHGGRGAFVDAAVVMHYLTAVATAAVVPWVARTISRRRPVTARGGQP